MDLINFLKKNDGSRKIFGQQELKIIEKQLWGMKLTQSEKNRLSRDIRKKLDFIKKIVKYEDEFDLKKGAEVRKLIEKANEVIKETKYFGRIRKLILYGSTISNERRINSDVDIAVVFDKIDIREATKFRIKVNFIDKVDIQVYNILPAKIKKEIDLKGKVLWKKE